MEKMTRQFSTGKRIVLWQHDDLWRRQYFHNGRLLQDQIWDGGTLYEWKSTRPEWLPAPEGHPKPCAALIEECGLEPLAITIKGKEHTVGSLDNSTLTVEQVEFKPAMFAVKPELTEAQKLGYFYGQEHDKTLMDRVVESVDTIVITSEQQELMGCREQVGDIEVVKPVATVTTQPVANSVEAKPSGASLPELGIVFALIFFSILVIALGWQWFSYRKVGR